RNLVLEILAASASPFARARAALRRVSSSVRSRTRRSSVSFARSSASAASTLAVMSVKVVTTPPSGMRLARTSMTMPSAKRSRNGSLLDLRTQKFLGLVGGPRSTPAVEAQDVGKPYAGAHETRRQVENLAELPVP